MNIAPFLLWRRTEKSWPDEEEFALAAQLVGDNWDELYDRFSLPGILQVYSLSELRPDRPGVAGLLHENASRWQQAMDRIEPEEQSNLTPKRFISAMKIESRESILLYPDDPDTNRANVSVFLPAANSSGNIVLRSLSFWIRPETLEIDSVVSGDDGLCAVRTALDDDGAVIDSHCERTGCKCQCDSLIRIIRMRFERLYCTCPAKP